MLLIDRITAISLKNMQYTKEAIICMPCPPSHFHMVLSAIDITCYI